MKAVLHREPGEDQLVILTNFRVVVTDYKYRKHGSILIKRWEAKLSDLREPQLEQFGGMTLSCHCGPAVACVRVVAIT
jgi:hypothetical protein